MPNGVIKMVNHLRGFGFIVTEEGDDVFFSTRDIHPKFKNTMLKEGLRVRFDLKREFKGDRAVNIHILK